MTFRSSRSRLPAHVAAATVAVLTGDGSAAAGRGDVPRRRWRRGVAVLGGRWKPAVAAGWLAIAGVTASAAAERSRVAFMANDIIHGQELYVSDGTAAGTRRVADLAYGTLSSATFFAPLPNRLVVMRSNNDPTGVRFYINGIDGTGKLSANLNPFPRNQNIELLGAAAGRAYFKMERFVNGVLGYDVYSTTGEDGSVKKVMDYRSTPTAGSYRVFELNRKAYISSPYYDSGMLKYAVAEVTDEGTSLRWSYDANGNGNDYPYFAEAGGKLFFDHWTERHGRELWVTDGTANGKRMVRELNPYQLDGVVVGTPLVGLGDRVLFTGETQVSGRQLWSSDGTRAGTQRITSFGPGVRYAPTTLKVFAGKGYFTEQIVGQHFGLWQTDGTRAGTKRLRPKIGGRDIFLADQGLGESFTVAGHTLYFTAFAPDDVTWDDEYPTALYRMNLTTGVTRLIKDINPNPGEDIIRSLRPTHDGRVFFSATNYYDPYAAPPQNRNDELWVTGGTADTTRVVKEIRRSPREGSFPYDIHAVPPRP